MLLSKILNGALPDSCLRPQNPTAVLDVPVKRTFLYQNVPNPFNPTTTIEFDLAAEGPTKLKIFDVAGRRVRTLADGVMTAGHHRLVWDGADDVGRRVSSGLYFYRLTTVDVTSTKRMVVLR